MKQRFSSLDVRVIAHELAEALVSLRLSNIYDLNSKLLLLKFAKPDNRQQLLIESGFRCHLTDFARAAAPAPSQFVSRLRKFLKTRRVTGVSQIGTDRIIEFQFSNGAYRLYLEFFASGNVILTDADLKILALLRNVPQGEGQEPQRVGLTYTLENRQNFGGVPALTKERLRGALKTASEQAATKKAKRKGSDELRRGLATTITELPPVLVDHVFRLTSFDPTTKPADILENEALLDALFQSLEKARSILDEVTSSPSARGYIIAKRNPRAADQVADGEETAKEKAQNLLYEDFQPFLPKQFEDDPTCEVLSFDGFSKTVDEFFSSLEGRNSSHACRSEAQLLNLRKAAAIEANVERVQEAMDAVNGLLQQGMDWVDINKLVEREQRLHNPVAEIIKLPMRLEESIITLLLGEEEEEAEAEANMDFDYDTDEEAAEEIAAGKAKGPDKRLAIDINLKLSPWNNAREYYEQKRTAADKQQKTIQQSEIALRNAEKKISEDLKKGLKQEKPVLQLIRKQMWFEKFLWFISSDGYLVLGGRDAQQNEILYKRYLRKGDVYVHADMHGAPSVIIKNNPKTPDAPIPPSTLAQAGSLSVCCSSAWDSKAVMGAWWVNADQVSKSAPTGEYLPAGSFMVRGKRNALPPALLTLGFGLMFKISEDSKLKHVKHRLYDSADVSTTGAASVSTPTEAKDDTTSRPESLAESSDEEEVEDDGEARVNPLQSSAAEQEEASGPISESDVTPPREELASLEATAERPTTAEPQEEPNPPGTEDAEAEEEADASPAPSLPTTTPSTRPETPSTTSQPQKSQQQKKQQPPKRGQRSKAKKIATKYKYQDEEDRALMEELLGVAAARQKAEAEAAARAKREAEAAAALERRRQAQERAKKQIAAHEEARRRAMLEGEDVLDDNDDDNAAGAAAGAGGWDRWTRWLKYKAKLQPGHVKKGKAVKEIVERWRLAAGKKGVVDERAQDVEKMWPREVELIKGLKVEEAFNVVPVSKVTVMMSGGTAGGGGSGGKGGGKGGSGGGGGGGGQKGGKGKAGKKK
ncbi:3e52d14f-b0ba-4b71-91c9-c394d2953dbb [Thermothielavioides terrestris]|uniref:Ribosome quality control complex subunit 2 n=1 Tax=Thermothielavioides terrestris TaxID=2587410 RepID=A0A3S4AK11_9PEZI|nr:3e52d14f-b0ba-4b71-91c9-c394d2953dbb [Thermothielavioides terrestris]